MMKDGVGGEFSGSSKRKSASPQMQMLAFGSQLLGPEEGRVRGHMAGSQHLCGGTIY